MTKQKLILAILIFSILFTISCKEQVKRQNPPLYIKDFKTFFETFKKAVKERDKITIERLASDDFHYSTYDFRNKWDTRELALENFDFDLAEKLLNDGYSEIIKGVRAYIPSFNKIIKNNGFKIDFINEGKGWQIYKILQGPVGEEKGAAPSKP